MKIFLETAHMRRRVSSLAVVAVLTCIALPAVAQVQHQASDLPLVPWPKSVHVTDGSLVLLPTARIVATDNRLLPLAKIAAEEIRDIYGLELSAAGGEARPGDIVLSLGKGRTKVYALEVADRATVAGADYTATAQGTVTLLQAMRNDGGKISLPRMTIDDEPCFDYCGAMLDIARKPHSIATLRRCVLAARMYKIRFIQLHMSDENAWTFPSTAYPKAGSTNFAWAGGDKPVVYKLDELKQLVAFADARGVTFVPELETPGHSGALRGSLPEVFGYKDNSGKMVGRSVINIVSDRAYQALDTIVGEMCEVFKSSPYFHVGCDESSLDIQDMPEFKEWVERHHLPEPHLSSVFGYHLQKMDEIVKKRGKRMIVWEGPPLDPIAPPKDVIFMPWVGGTGSAAEYVRRGYSIINPPWGVKSPYFDPFDVNGAEIPRAQKLLIGATSISWEATEDKAMSYFRYIGALRNEPTWNPNTGRDLNDFLARHQRADALLDALLCGLTCRAEGLLDRRVFGRPEAMFGDKVSLSLAIYRQPSQVRYTLDGSEPTAASSPYTAPIELTDTATLKARCFSAYGKPLADTFSQEYRKVTLLPHDAVGAKITVDPPISGSYSGPAERLVDGILAPADSYGDPGWIGWFGGHPITITLDLTQAKTVRNVIAHFCRSGGGLEIPKSVTVSLSDDGRTFHEVASVARLKAASRRGWYIAELAKPESARYIRVVAVPAGEWTFIDEVALNAKVPAPTLAHAARGKTVKFATPPSSSYSESGLDCLTDGYIGSTPHCANLGWLGWEATNFDATIDLGKPTPIRTVGGHFMQFLWAGIYMPAKIDVLVSDDGTHFKSAAVINTPASKDGQFVRTLAAKLDNVTARYVRIVAYTNGMWLFCDELIVNPGDSTN